MKLTLLSMFVIFQVIILVGFAAFGCQSYQVNRRICSVKFPSINQHDCAITLYKLEYISVVMDE